MKKLILIIMFSSLLLSENEKTLYQKIIEMQNITIKDVVFIKKSFFDKTNYILPDFLRIDKETSTLNLKLQFDTNEKKFKASANIKIKLPAFETKKDVNVSSKNKVQIEHYIISLSIRPIVRVKKAKIKPYLRIKLTQMDNKHFLNVYEYQIYTNNYWVFYLKYLIIFNKIYSNITFSTNKEIESNWTYSYYLSYMLIKNKKKSIFFTYNNGGTTPHKPIISFHKFLFSYREFMFNSKRIFYEITPYFIYNKDKKFKLEPNIYFSLNYVF